MSYELFREDPVIGGMIPEGKLKGMIKGIGEDISQKPCSAIE